jgi:hypothetical protein
MSDPGGKTQAALAETRGQLGSFHEHGLLAPGRTRRMERDSMDARLRFKLDPIWVRTLHNWDEEVRMRAAFTREERARLLHLLDEDAARKPAREGRHKNGDRDHWITRVVANLVEFHGLAPTRNRGARRGSPESACSIVAQVLRELRVGLSESAVETIWRKRRPGTSPSAKTE